MSTKASAIYNQQNKIIHRALRDMGMTYKDDKDVLLALFTDIAKRKVTGLSNLSLGERYKVIKHFRQRGVKVFNPAIGRHLWKWRKGHQDKVSEGTNNGFEPGRPLSVPATKKPLLSKVGAILADMKLPWSYADSIAKQMHGIRFVEWCNPAQLHKIVAAMVINQRSHYA
jgi:phage gp16-like protein